MQDNQKNLIMSAKAKEVHAIQDNIKRLIPYNPHWQVSPDRHQDATCNHKYTTDGSKNDLNVDILPSITVELTNNVGRQLVATRHIEAGELLFCEPPLLDIVPPQGDIVICVSCLQNLEYDFPSCSGCGAPKCRTQCEGSEGIRDLHTPEECHILSKYGFTDKLTLEEKLSMIKTFNAVITPLRVLKEIETSPEKAELLWAFEDNVTKRKFIPNGLEKEYKVARLIQEQLQLDIEPNELIRIWGIYESNSFEVPVSEKQKHRGCGLFTTTCMMNHSCTFNAQVAFFDGLAHVWSTQDIPVGSSITINYSQHFLGSTARRLSLLKSKLFNCQCARCIDPTELGSHLSSIKCSQCDTGLLIPPVKNLKDNWSCCSCEMSIKFSTIETLTSATATFMAKVDKNDINDMTKTLSMLEQHLGSQNSTCVVLKHNLVSRLMREPLPELSSDVLWSIMEMTQSLLEIVNIVALGKSFIRGHILLYLVRASSELLFRKHCDDNEYTTDKPVRGISTQNNSNENKKVCENSRFSRTILSEHEMGTVINKERNVDEINISDLMQQLQESRSILKGERKHPKDTRVLEVFLNKLSQKQNVPTSLCNESNNAHKTELTNI